VPNPTPPRPGELLWIDRPASVQFASAPFTFLLLRVHGWSTYDGWVWLDGLHLDPDGHIVQRRSIFVAVAGLTTAPAQHPRPDPAQFMEQINRESREPDCPRRTR